jgi:hypothetical protein
LRDSVLEGPKLDGVEGRAGEKRRKYQTIDVIGMYF